MNRTSKIGVALAGLAGVLGAIAIASPAQAYVYDCGVYWPTSYTVQGYCGGGTGSFRLLVDCANVHGVSTIGSNWYSRTATYGYKLYVYTEAIGCGSGYITNPRVDAR